MLQIKNITPNKLTNKPMILNENGEGTVSFEIDGNEKVDKAYLLSVSKTFTEQILDPIIWEEEKTLAMIGKEEYNYEDGITLSRTNRAFSVESFDSITIVLKNNIELKQNEFELTENNKINSYEVSFKFSYPYKIYLSYNGSDGMKHIGYNNKKQEEIYNFEKIHTGIIKYLEEENNWCYIENDTEEKIMIKDYCFVLEDSLFLEDSLSLKDVSVKYFSGFSVDRKDELKINDNVIAEKDKYSPKIKVLLDQESFISNSTSSNTILDTETKQKSAGYLFYFLKPEMNEFTVLSSETRVAENLEVANSSYKNFMGKNQSFEFLANKNIGNYKIALLKSANQTFYQSPLISYDILKHPVISNISFERTFGEGFNQDYDYCLSFYYDENNQFPMLWYQVKIYNIIGENRTIIYNTDKVFTSINQIYISPIHLLPNEKYQYEIQISDTQNMVSTYVSDEDLETSKAEEKINFSEQSIKKYLSESFIKLELNKFGIYQQGIYPSTTLFPGNIYPKDSVAMPSKYQKLKLLRENLVSKQTIWIDEKEWINKEPSYFIYDYGIKANTPYNYWAYAIDENGVLSGVKINNEPIIAEWDRWTLVTANKDPENEKVYHVDKVFTFEMNLSYVSMTNGFNITMSKNFTEFPVIQKDKSNFYSGSLTALMGVRKWGSTAEDFEQTPHMLEELRQLSTNYQPKFLKDRSGHLWRVEINGAIQVANTDNLATIDLKTMTVPWVQIGEADDISLIYTGTEKKEDLYC